MNKSSLAVTLVLVMLTAASAAIDKKTLVVRAISHDVQTSRSSNGGFDEVEVTQVVEADGTRYTLSCSGVPFSSAVYKYCEWLHFDGDTFEAETDGKTMTVHARKGGNQGKPIKLKFKITDIRSATDK